MIVQEDFQVKPVNPIKPVNPNPIKPVEPNPIKPAEPNLMAPVEPNETKSNEFIHRAKKSTKAKRTSKHTYFDDDDDDDLVAEADPEVTSQRGATPEISPGNLFFQAVPKETSRARAVPRVPEVTSQIRAIQASQRPEVTSKTPMAPARPEVTSQISVVSRVQEVTPKNHSNGDSGQVENKSRLVANSGDISCEQGHML